MSRRETPEVSEAVVRLVRAIGRRVGADGNPEYMAELRVIEEAIGLAYRDAVAGLREAGFSDGVIGRTIGMSRQAVRQRWPAPAPRPRRPVPSHLHTGSNHAQH